jgi:hypothetical protein
VATFKQHAVENQKLMTWKEFRGLLEAHGFDTWNNELVLRRAFQQVAAMAPEDSSSSSSSLSPSHDPRRREKEALVGLSKSAFVKLLTPNKTVPTLPGKGAPCSPPRGGRGVGSEEVNNTITDEVDEGKNRQVTYHRCRILPGFCTSVAMGDRNSRGLCCSLHKQCGQGDVLLHKEEEVVVPTKTTTALNNASTVAKTAVKTKTSTKLVTVRLPKLLEEMTCGRVLSWSKVG